MKTQPIQVLLILLLAGCATETNDNAKNPFEEKKSIVLSSDGEVYYYDPLKKEKWAYQPSVLGYDSIKTSTYPVAFKSRMELFSSLGWNAFEAKKEEGLDNQLFFEPYYSEYEIKDDIDAAENLNAVNDCDLSKSRKLKELNQGSKTIRKVFNRKQKHEASAFGILNLNLTKGQFVSIIDYAEHMEKKCKDTDYMLYAGVRMRFDIQNIEAKFDLKIPSKLAAASELELASVSVTLETIGWKNDKSRKLIADWINVPLNIEKLSLINKIIPDLMKIMKDDMDVIPNHVDKNLVEE